MYGFIYMTVNMVNNKKYIGMCKNTHSKNYLGSGKILKDAIKKYGKENFKRIVLEECQTFEELSKAEKRWIEHYDAVENQEFYNLTDGGFGGNSNSMKEYWSNFDSDERKKVRNWKKPDMSGKNNPMFGKQHSEETKKKIGMKSVDRNWKKHDYAGSKNPRAKKVIVEMDGKIIEYKCLKDFSNEFQHLSYSSLKLMAQKQLFSEKYKLKITYA